MGNISKLLPKETKTVQAIYDMWKERGDSEPARTYLGASILGHHCSRFLWYLFRWAGGEEFSGRIYRLFDRGNAEEPRMVEDLRAIGCEVHEIDPVTGKQFAVEFADGHGGGHMDGCVLGIPEAPKTWHVVEFKTHSTKSFGRLRDGVQVSKPVHYAQVQVYMRLTGMERALYLAVDKNDEYLYSERIKLDKEFADRLLRKAEQIVKSDRPPMRAGSDCGASECKYCPFPDLCHGNPNGVAVPCAVNCRTCAFAQPEDQGLWICAERGRVLSKRDQERGCAKHIFCAQIVTFAEAVNTGVNDDGAVSVEYMNEDNTVWVNGPGHWTSEELTKVPMSEVGKEGSTVGMLREIFDGKVVGSE